MYRSSEEAATHEEPWKTIITVGLRETCARVCGHLADARSPETFETQLFDRLTREQKVAMLATVGESLLKHSVNAPPLTAVVEATAATILEVFVEELVVEADTNGYAEVREEHGDPPFTTCRAALLALLQPDWVEEDMDPLPAVESCDVEAWKKLAENIFSDILWDYDFEDEDLYVDSSPEASEELKDRMNINPEYYIATAPEPTSAEFAEHLAVLTRLTGENYDAEIDS